MPSALNALLRKFDNLAYDKDVPTPVKLETAFAVLKGIDTLFADPEYEVHRDLFDGVSNETRRAVVCGFAATFADLFGEVQSFPIAFAIVAGKPATVPQGKAPPGGTTLDDILRAQPGNRN